MPSTYKYITDDKIQFVSEKLYESVPITGTYISGSYADENIVNYSHARFQTVYDYPYLSSSANKLFDITFGYSNDSTLSSSASVQNAEKIAIYNQIAQVFQGFDVIGNVNKFDQDGNIADGGTKLKECVFLFFDRTFVKDGIKKGTFSATFLTGTNLNSAGSPGAEWAAAFGLEHVNDLHATQSYFINSPVGEWSYLSGSTKGKVGLIFYGAGLVVLTGSIFTSSLNPDLSPVAHTNQRPVFFYSSLTGLKTFEQALTSTYISQSANGLRRRIDQVQFVNTTEINSQIVFLDIGPNEFNYSSNPTYLLSSKIRTKDDATDIPVSYFNELGLYSADNELLAVGKLSEKVRKNAGNALSIRSRLDF
jgi:hypothetical protein